MAVRPQRIRNPVHNLIEFGTDQFEHALWEAIQTPPFQRLRRIRQLGFPSSSSPAPPIQGSRIVLASSTLHVR